MAKKRPPYLIISTGRKNVGKSYQTFKYILKYIKKHLRKVLIFDIQGEYGVMRPAPDENEEGLALFENKAVRVPAIAVKDILKFSANNEISIRRIKTIHTDTKYEIKKNGQKGKLLHRRGDIMLPDEIIKALIKTINSFRGGLLLIEDFSSMFGDSIPQALIGLITSNRHRNLDIYMHLQSIGPIIPRLYQNCNFVFYHKQLDSVDKSKGKLLDRYEMYKIAEYIVDDKYENVSEHYGLWIDNDKAKIKGDFTEQDMRNAIDMYLRRYSSRELNFLLKERDSGGNPIYDYNAALTKRTNELFKKYWGN